MLIAEPYQDGNLRGTVYRFAAGDVLPLHDHTPADSHISIITRGSFTITDNGGARVRGPGPFLSFDPGNPHEFLANEPSVLVNIIKGG